MGKAGAALGSGPERLGLPGPPARLARLSAECLRGSGASYRGSRQVASGGAPCLNWLTVRSGPGAGLPAGGSGPGGRWGGSRGSGGCRGRADGPAALWQSMRTTTAAGTRTATPRPGATSKALPGSPSGDPATSPSAQVRASPAGLPLFLPSLACPVPRGAAFVTRVGSPLRTNNPGYGGSFLGNTAYPGLPSSPRLCVHICSQLCRAPPLELFY